MKDINDFIKIKEYDKFILYQHKKLGYKECMLKAELHPPKNIKRKWER